MRGELLILLLITLLFSSCTQKSFDSKDELLSYIQNPENGFLKEKNINGIKISIQYRPTDLIVFQDIQNSNSKTKIDSLRSNYLKYNYFIINFSINNRDILNTLPKNNNEFGGLISKFSFGMNDLIHLYNSKKDTLKLIDVIYPRLYGYSKATSLLIIFPNDRKLLKTENFYITLEDFGFKTGEIKFTFKSDIIKKQPKLNFDS